MVRREKQPIATVLLTLSCLRNRVAFKSTGATVVRACVIRSSTVRTDCSILIVRVDSGARGTNSFIRNAFNAIGVTAWFTSSISCVWKESRRTRGDTVRKRREKEEARLAKRTISRVRAYADFTVTRTG